MFRKNSLFALILAIFFISNISLAESISDYKLSSLITIRPQNELQISFFPAYLQAAFRKYKQDKKDECSADLNDIKLSRYSAEPEKFYLLQAYCTKKNTPEELSTEIQSLLKKALAQKASNSDVLYAAGLALAGHSINDQALQYLVDARWFNSFKQIPMAQYFYTLGRVQLALGMPGEAHNSLVEAQKRGLKDSNFSLILLESKLLIGDRKTAINISNDLKGYPAYVKTAYQIRSLILQADPIFNKKDIQTAAQLTEQMGLKTAENKDLAIPAIKAMLFVKNFDLAKKISEKALSLEPEDPLLNALKTQALAEEEQELKAIKADQDLST